MFTAVTRATPSAWPQPTWHALEGQLRAPEASCAKGGLLQAVLGRQRQQLNVKREVLTRELHRTGSRFKQNQQLLW
jgi:hypothetical protein